MNPAQATALRDILQTQQIAALGTLHKGEPFVSMVPYAILPDGNGFVIHVSQLATHTKDMLLSPGVSLLIVALPTSEVPAQATARVTIQGQAKPCADSTQGHAEARAAYLSRFPQTAEIFSFADFSLFVIQPSSVRFVGGFARATTLAPEVLANILSKG
jgi:heme iron utilization protein